MTLRVEVSPPPTDMRSVEKVQVAEAGRPAQPKASLSWNVAAVKTVIAAEPWAPVAMLMVGGCMLRVNSIGGPTVTVTLAEADKAKRVSPE